MPVDTIGDLYLEVTRRCNLRCAHCCRGDAQEVDMSGAALAALLGQVRQVGQLGFTGGEPTQAPQALERILTAFLAAGVSVATLELVTSGVGVPENFWPVWSAWLDYCDHPENVRVFISVDRFHPGPDVDESRFRCQVIRRDLDEVYAQGRYADAELPVPLSEEILLSGNSIASPLYMNVYGDILSGVDWSYSNQGREKICNIMTADLLAAIKGWNR